MNLYDIIVCGGGTAGVCAAIAAGRRGKRVLLIEQLGFLGGSQTGALVLPYMNYHTPAQQLITGLHQEIIDRLAAWPGGVKTSFFNYELLKYVLEEMVVEAGVDIRYHTFISDTLTDNKRIAGVVTHSKSGRQEYAARQVIDCTGDADVAFLAGVPCESGRKEDGLNQSASLRFVVGNVDLEALSTRLEELDRPSVAPELHMGFAKGHTHAPKIEELIDRGVAEGIWTEADAVYIQFFSIPGRPGEIAFNCPRITYINGTRAEDLTRVQIEGRRMIPRVIAWCQTYLRGFDDCYLLTTASLPGIRESRRIIGEHVLTAEECIHPTRFPDRIAKSNYPIDIHSPTGGGITLQSLNPGEYHDIPYRCLVPLEVDDLLVAGRCISSTFEAQAAIRIEPTCRALGEAAGMAAVLCIEHGCTPRDLSPEALLVALGDAGANVWV